LIHRKYCFATKESFVSTLISLNHLHYRL